MRKTSSPRWVSRIEMACMASGVMVLTTDGRAGEGEKTPAESFLRTIKSAFAANSFPQSNPWSIRYDEFIRAHPRRSQTEIRLSVLFRRRRRLVLQKSVLSMCSYGLERVGGKFGGR